MRRLQMGDEMSNARWGMIDEKWAVVGDGAVRRDATRRATRDARARYPTVAVGKSATFESRGR